MEERIAQLIAFTGTSREQALTCLQGAPYFLSLSTRLVAPLNGMRVSAATGGDVQAAANMVFGG